MVVLDDLHWGEPTFLDLVEQVADLSRGAPVFLLCLARPELLDRRPAWGGGKLNATTVLLEPLNSDEAGELIERLLPAAAVTDPALRTRALEAAAGNPLFLEEIAAVAASSGGNVLVPPTIQALLAARLDQLDPAERRVLERGSVEGSSFHRGAVEALGPEETSVPAKLVTLVRKDLVRPDEATFPGDDAFRFRHLLIRDAAYDGLPKSVRARLHETFANWLDERASDLAERDEIIGYHLEQACRYRRELGSVDVAAQAMATAAVGRLESAGRRALERGDARAALNLLERASSLGTPGRVDISLELSVVWAMFQVGRFSDAAARAGAASSRAAEAGDRIGQLRAELARVYLLAHLDPEGRLAQLDELIERARPVFEQAGDHAALGSLSMATWALEHLRCRFGAAADAAIQAAEHAAAAGEQYLATWCRTNAAAGIAFGPMPVTEALEWIDRQAALLEKPPTWREFWQARLLPLVGRFDEARAAHRSDVEQMAELGDRLGAALDNGWEIEMQAGQFDRAVEAGRQACRRLEEMGERAYWSTKACEVAEALYRLGRYEEAETWAQQAADVGASDDAITQLMSREVLAKVAARQGQFEQARAVAAEALAIADGMDAPLSQGDACLDVAEVLWLAGDHSGAIRHAERAARSTSARARPSPGTGPCGSPRPWTAAGVARQPPDRRGRPRASSLEQLLHLAEPRVPRVAQPFEQHHLRGHDLGTVLPRPVDRGRPVSRVARADGVGRYHHATPGADQAQHRLQDAHVRLAPGHDDLAGPGREQRGEIRVAHRRERGLRHDLLRVGRERRHRRSQAGRVLLGREDRHVKKPRRLREPHGPGDHNLVVVDGGHEPLLQVDQQQHVRPRQ